MKFRHDAPLASNIGEVVKDEMKAREPRKD